jgi:photosystem II stability/assembly factor-like uncharacterized protein
MRFIFRFFVLISVIAPLSSFCIAQNWQNAGPDGGDARSFASDPGHPQRILLGTTSSWIYESLDGGAHWHMLAKVTDSDSMVIDNLIVDESRPTRLVAGAWVLNHEDGGIFISEDEGHHWRPVPQMRGQSVRALAQSASNPKIFVAGTLRGVYESNDGGEDWTQISPAGSTEIHEIESVAIDPVHPAVIYAGTWHLPWKTEDGGKSWRNIKQGVIDDSDVFSIIIDPVVPETVYASACSGIYKSLDGGAQFYKVQGIPATARRTRVLMQDPMDRNVVYAGTTQGLYKTVDAGSTWKLMTPDDIIINDVHIDPKAPQHVLLATDRSGVLASEDGMQSFHASNSGFTQQQVETLAVDARQPSSLYVGLLNDKRFGGVFFSPDDGATWVQRSDGLDGRDVYSLVDTNNGDLMAGTSHGIFRWTGAEWKDTGHRLMESTHRVTRRWHGKRITVTDMVAAPDGSVDGSVRSLAHSHGHWYAATSQGLYTSADPGFIWYGGPVMGASDFRNVSAQGNTVLANAGSRLYLSVNAGNTWKALPLPGGWERVRFVALDAYGQYWVGGRRGVAVSRNQGRTWQVLPRLPITDISGLAYDAHLRRVMVTSYAATVVLGMDPTTLQYAWWDPGWHTHAVQWANNRLVAATFLHGVVLQPQSQAPAAAH